MPTDIQYKNELRKELMMYQDYLELLKKDQIKELEEKFLKNIDRIQASLQD